MLVFDQVDFYYRKDAPVLQELQLTIRKGEYVAVIGPNGSGKSTMAKLMNGLVVPKKGEETCFGKSKINATDVQQIRQHVSYVFQNREDQFITTHVFEEFIYGFENIQCPKENMEERVREVLSVVGMSGFAAHFPQ